VGILTYLLFTSGGGKDVEKLLREGNRLGAAGDWTGALVKFQSAKELDPTNERVLGRVADAERELKASSEVARKAREDAEKKAARDRNRKEEARVAAQPEFDNARNAFQRARTDLYRQVSDFSKIDQELQDAVDHCTKAISIFPEDHEAYHLRGQAHYLRQSYADAEKDFTAAIGILSTSSAAFYDRGRVYLDLASEAAGQSGLRGAGADEEAKPLREKARSDFAAYREKGGGDPEQTEIAEALLAVSEQAYDRASKICDRLIEKQTSNEEVYKVKGDALFQAAHSSKNAGQRSGLYRDSIQAYTEALARRVNYPEAYLGRGHALAHAGDRDAATRDLGKATPIGRGSAGWYSARGMVLYELGRKVEAIRDFESAISLRPNDTAVLTNLGMLYYQQQDLPRAIELFNRALSIDPKHLGALTNRGLCQAARGDTGAALQDFEAALAIDPKYGPVFLYRGSAYNSRREYARAEEDLNRYIEAYPSLGEGYFHRGIARYNLNHLPEAIADWEKAASLDPNRKAEAERRIAQAKERLAQ
jgi:tetratricopeptide (TPR) repeat protein